ncbi:MAG: LLM class flavin-dependent oxidoreductase [Cytophagaceae bacterium]|nr:LLM class flavin-dependent oxidoreductase [Gemmatimonadaceae bacterium]
MDASIQASLRRAPLSVLDLSPIVAGGTPAQSFRNSLDLARHAERLGYHRFWVAEHHGIPGVASAATAVVIAHVAGGTSSIRVGAGGIMLPNHAPLLIAEQFGTLEALFPGRIDLGLGRAPGSDQVTARALRRDRAAADAFPHDVAELIALMEPSEPGQVVRAIPGEGTRVPIWILGSSLFGAQLAAAMGLPFAFASHFAPMHMMQAIEIYRTSFRPSERCERPRVMLGATVVAADTDDEARLLLSSLLQTFVALRRGHPIPVPPPDADFEGTLTPLDRAQLDQILSHAIVGGPARVRDGLASLIARTGADEVMVATQIYDHAARVHSFEIVAAI